MNQSYVCALIAMMVRVRGGRGGTGTWRGATSGAERPHPAHLQVWSITYHSWLTFVLLLWACLIWIVRSRQHFAMLCSPFLLLYGVALCSLQYVWAMDLAPELPTRVGFMSLKQLGLVRPKYPCLDLGAKVSPVSPSLSLSLSPLVVLAHCPSPQLLLTLTFWLLLRQFVKEKLLTRRCPATPLLEVTVSDTGEGSWCHPPEGTLQWAEHPQDASTQRLLGRGDTRVPPTQLPAAPSLPRLAEPSRQRDVLKALGALVRDFYAKYWICVCAGMFIVVSFAGRLVVYKIVYMFLFLLCLTLFQVGGLCCHPA